MARDFDGSTQYAEVAAAVTASYPITLACWFNVDNKTAKHTLLSINKSGDSTHKISITADGPRNSGTVVASAQAGGSEAVAVSTTQFSASTWHHAVGVFTSNASRTVYLDAGGSATAAGTRSPTLDTTSIARAMSGTNACDGRIAEAAVWSIELSAADIASLARGVSPLRVRPDALVAYWPLVGRASPEIDVVGNNVMTLTNSPTAAAHPRVIRRRARRFWTVPAAGGGGIAHNPFGGLIHAGGPSFGPARLVH